MNNHPEYITINWKTTPSIKPRSHNTKYKVSSVFTNLSLSIFLRFRVNDTAFYHTSQTTMSYMRCPMNINSSACQGISSAHSQVGESDGVQFLHESKWSTLDEFRLWSQVSKGGIWQRVGLCFECGSCGLWTSWSVKLPSGHSFTIVCSQQFKSSEGANCRMQKQTLHCWFQIMFSWENIQLYSHPTVDKITSKISWMKEGAQRRLVNYLGQWKTVLSGKIFENL